jgi:hypothetical protein
MSKKPDLMPRKPYGEAAGWSIHAREAWLMEAEIARDIAIRWALVTGIPDGEDSAGRQKLRLPTAEELAERSANIASALYTQFDQRGWLFEIPAQADAEKANAERREKEKANDRE